MPKVLLLNDGLGNGGAERQLSLLARCLPPRWQCQVWVMQDGPYAQVLQDAGIPVSVCRRAARFDIRPAFDLYNVLLRWRPDVVHSWGWMSSMAAGPLCKLLGIPMIDGTIRMWRPARRARARRWGMRWADRVIANSQAGLAAWSISSSRGRVVYNGFDPARLALCQTDEGAKYGVFTVVMAARMHPHKDWRSFFAAVRELLREGALSWNVLAIGNGPDRHALQAEARDLVEAGVVSFPEAGLEVLPFVRRAHVGVLMSGSPGEGCSNAIMEYMACGLPVVCSESGGNRELVLDGRTGFIVPQGDARELASRLAYLRRETAHAREMGMAGRRRLLTAFSADAMVAETLRVYAEAVQLHAHTALHGQL